MKAKVRDSNLELMRLFAIFSVIMYHTISYYTLTYSPENSFGYVAWLPFRTAVTLFVLTSGYFGIKFSYKGFLRIIAKTWLLFVPFEIGAILIGGGQI